MEGLSLKGTILTDQSLVTSILLVNCILDDMRKGREGKLNRLIGRTEELYKAIETSKAVDSAGPVRSMIDITFQQKGNDMFGRCLSLFQSPEAKICPIPKLIIFGTWKCFYNRNYLR